MMQHSPIVAAREAAITFEREAFSDALKLVARTVERRNTIPILSTVMIEARPGALSIRGNSLDLMAVATVLASVDVPLSVCLDAAALSDAVRKMPKGSQVTLKVAEGKAHLSAGRARFNITAQPVDDFPIMLEPGATIGAFDLDGPQLEADLRAVAPAMSTEEQRYYLNGIAVQREADRLIMVATDGLNACIVDRPAAVGSDALGSVIIPRQAVAFLLHALKRDSAGPVALRFCDYRFEAQMPGGLTVTGKLVDGSFPDWRAALDKAIGEGELEAISPMMLALDPRLPVDAFAKLGKALPGPVDIALGEQCTMLTCEGEPAWSGFSMLKRADEGDAVARKGFGINARTGADGAAIRYLQSIAEEAGLPVDQRHVWTNHEGARKVSTEPTLLRDGVFYRGLLVGPSERVEQPAREELCWETLSTRTIPARSETVYGEGACCVLMPEHSRADVSVELDGKRYPLATNATGEIALTAEQVRTIAGPVDESTFVRIPRFTMHKGAIIAIDGIATDGTGRAVIMPGTIGKRAKRNDRAVMTRDAIAAALKAGEPVYIDQPDEAEPVDHISDVPEMVVPVAAEPEPVKAPEEPAQAEPHFSPPVAEIAPQPADPAPDATIAAIVPVAGPKAGIKARLAALEAAVTALQAGAPVAAVSVPVDVPAAPETAPVARVKDPARLRMIRRYLQMRAERADLVAAVEAAERRVALADEAGQLSVARLVDENAALQAQLSDARGQLDEATRAKDLACAAAVAAQEAVASYRAEAERCDRLVTEARDEAGVARDKLAAAEAEAKAAMQLAVEESNRADQLERTIAQLRARPEPEPRTLERRRFEVVN